MSDDKKVVAQGLTFNQLLRVVAIGPFARFYGALKKPDEDKADEKKGNENA